MDDFVEVYDRTSGIPQRVPRDWLGDPILGRNIAKTVQQRVLDNEIGEPPTEDSTLEEIRAFAETADIDITGLKKKPQIFEAVTAALSPHTAVPVVLDDEGNPLTPDAVPVAVETPGTGDKEN